MNWTENQGWVIKRLQTKPWHSVKNIYYKWPSLCLAFTHVSDIQHNGSILGGQSRLTLIYSEYNNFSNYLNYTSLLWEKR